MSDRYILNDQGEPVPEPNLYRWGWWLEHAERRIVKQEEVGPSKVSTVFLGLDHSFVGGPPILWETLVFGGELDEEMDRCSGTREQAEAMHLKMVERVRKNLNEPSKSGEQSKDGGK